jgi:hypothetical protein
MESALIVIPLLGLTLPISMLVGAILFDAVIASWAVYKSIHDRRSHKPV